MIPAGTSIYGEIQLNSGDTFVICLIIEDVREKISAFLTDCEDLFLASIETEKLSELTKNLKLSNPKQLKNILKEALREKKILFNKEELSLIFCLKNSENVANLPATLKEVEQGSRSKYLKALLCHMVQRIQEQENFSSPSHGMSYISTVPSGARNKPAKPRPPGMSLVHPGTKRIRSESSGVPAFDEEI